MTHSNKVIKITSEKLISHSGRQLWATCNRKFQLAKLQTFARRAKETSSALGFGSGFGVGVQSLLSGKTLDESFLLSALSYSPDFAYEDSSIKKQESLAHCHAALSVFYHSQLPALSSQWQVLKLPGFYGVELGFAIQYPNGTIERGFIDLVLQNIETKEVVVLEIKTSGAYKINEESAWANSPQGLMYLLIVKYLLSKLNLNVNSKVLYLEYNKPAKHYSVFPFEKSKREIFEFIQGLDLDVSARETQFSPSKKLLKSGNCSYYGRLCDFYGICDIDYPLDYYQETLTFNDETNTHLINYLDLLNYANI